MKALSMLRKYRNSVESGMVSAEYAVGTIATTVLPEFLFGLPSKTGSKNCLSHCSNLFLSYS